jgi:hypothetical protein
MLPKGFAPRDISGWPARTGGLLEASRQLQQGYHLELARRAREELGERLTLIEPIDYTETRGVSFYDLFLDRTQWPRLIRQGYDEANRVLQRSAEPQSASAAHARAGRQTDGRKCEAMGSQVPTEGENMADSVYRVTEVVGVSSDSWEQATKNAVEKVSETVRDLGSPRSFDRT